MLPEVDVSSDLHRKPTRSAKGQEVRNPYTAPILNMVQFDQLYLRPVTRVT